VIAQGGKRCGVGRGLRHPLFGSFMRFVLGFKPHQSAYSDRSLEFGKHFSYLLAGQPRSISAAR
jgi:hypothetical protein